MNHEETFDPSFFEQLRKAEEKHFWFSVRRKWIFDELSRLVAPPAKFLEVGCGTGNVSSFLSRKGYEVTGCEFYPDAIQGAWPGFRIIQGDANDLPFSDKHFDIVGLFDVIEHFQDDMTPLREAVRVVKGGGIVAVTVPAREELWSWFDEVSLHKRRYTKETLKRMFVEMQLQPLVMKYMFMSLYLPMKYLRSKGETVEDAFRISRVMNILLKGLFDGERLISKGLSLPIGTSLIAIARKVHCYQ
jgi:SAM-dependent methyltransferase